MRSTLAPAGSERSNCATMACTLNDVVWRDAATGGELARTSESLTAISSGSMVEPYCSGKMLYLARVGEIIELTVS